MGCFCQLRDRKELNLESFTLLTFIFVPAGNKIMVLLFCTMAMRGKMKQRRTKHCSMRFSVVSHSGHSLSICTYPIIIHNAVQVFKSLSCGGEKLISIAIDVLSSTGVVFRIEKKKVTKQNEKVSKL